MTKHVSTLQPPMPLHRNSVPRGNCWVNVTPSTGAWTRPSSCGARLTRTRISWRFGAGGMRHISATPRVHHD